VIRSSLARLKGLAHQPMRLLALLLALVALGLLLALLGTQWWASYHLRAAQAALRLARLDQARDHVAQCLRVWPDHFDACLLAAQVARRAEDYEEAERHLTRCQEQRGGGLPEEVALEQMLVRAQRGGMDTLMPYLRGLVEQEHPASPLILEAMARGYIRAFRYGDAAAVLAVWVSRDPDNIQARLLQGFVREQNGPKSQAAEDFRRVIELDPDNEEARLRLGLLLLLERAMPAEAAVHLEYLVRKQPDNPDALTRLALCRLTLNRQEEAREILQGVLQAHPRHRLALSAWGELAMQTDQPAEAERCFRQVLAIDRADYLTLFKLHKCLRQLGKDREAQATEDRLRVMEADGDRIRKIIKEELPYTPNSPALQTEIGTILLRSGSDREGRQWLYSALRSDPGYLPAHRALVAYYRRIGDTPMAARHLRFLPAGEAGSPQGSPDKTGGGT
jgi:tetratricopeptide (TPR) repeat protein